jgi:hypothetical protein
MEDVVTLPFMTALEFADNVAIKYEHATCYLIHQEVVPIFKFTIILSWPHKTYKPLLWNYWTIIKTCTITAIMQPQPCNMKLKQQQARF